MYSRKCGHRRQLRVDVLLVVLEAEVLRRKQFVLVAKVRRLEQVFLPDFLHVRLGTDYQDRDLTLGEVFDVYPGDVLEGLGVVDVVHQAGHVAVDLARLQRVQDLAHVNVPQNEVLLLAVHLDAVDCVLVGTADLLVR